MYLINSIFAIASIILFYLRLFFIIGHTFFISVMDKAVFVIII